MALRPRTVTGRSTLLGNFDGGSKRTGRIDPVQSHVDRSQPDESARVAEVLIEDRQVAPGRVVRDVADRRIEAWGCVFRGQSSRQIADLFGSVIVVQRQRQR